MTFLPVVQRELRVAARRRLTFRVRLGFAVLAVVVGGGALALMGMAPRSGQGGGVFRFLAWVLFAYASAAGLFLTADCLSRERREGTLGLMFLTDLHAYDVVLGKLVARSLAAGYGMLAVFPVMAVVMLLGGVTVGEFWRVSLSCVMVLFLSLSVGAWVSALSEDDAWAMGMTVVALAGLAGLVPLASFAVSGKVEPGTGMLVLSPWSALVRAFDLPYRESPGAYWRSLGTGAGLACLALAAACWFLPRVWREGGVWRARFNGLSRRCRGNPTSGRRRSAVEGVAWLVGRTTLIQPVVLWGTVVGLVFVLAWVDLGVARFKEGAFPWTTGGVAFALRCVVAVVAGRFFVEGRRGGHLEILLCTPLSGRELLEGQWHALRQRFILPVVLVVWLSWLPVVLTLGWLNTGADDWAWVRHSGAAVYATVRLVADLLAAAWVGIWLGLTSRRPSWAPGLALLYGVLLPELLFCVPNVLIDYP